MKVKIIVKRKSLGSVDQFYVAWVIEEKGWNWEDVF